ncbi:hypothetical protein [Variovorax sp. OV329]|uniref:hypothetical protein n=1 Tax=Variovorax sp. OV329 TaxID=1882825 RepID=UPI0020C8D135|nr:hypothetical protein [Variovorax sp. OV329]
MSSFKTALDAAGATVIISATFRPPERAYLMHWSWRIANGAKPESAASMNGVNIEWVHPTDAASRKAAEEMVTAFQMNGLQVAPALQSRHTEGAAIDMNISWSDGLEIRSSDGSAQTIESTPRTGMNAELHKVGATYGVLKFSGGAADRPHWSDNGH